MWLQNTFENCVFDASELVSTKTLLLKHHYRFQGAPEKKKVVLLPVPVPIL